jgi:hypothetical protein
MLNRTKIILLLILIILIFLISFYYNYTLKFNNDERHLYDNNNYAHFSKITKNNIYFYPKYLLSNPQKYILNEGDALIIPKKWWHWVFSYENTFGINYWYDHNHELFTEIQIIENFIKPCNIKNNKIKNYLFNFETLNGNKDDIININMDDLINSTKNNEYLLTLDAFTNNKDIRYFLSENIEHPQIIIDNKLNKNYNFWYSPNKMDTGLHYDDNNGILCVLSGKKIVYLYPPNDSKYLYPYDIKPKWFYNKFEDMEYNIYKLNNDILDDKIASNNILYESFRNTKKSMCKIVDYLDKYSKKINNTIIYGIKNDKSKKWYEYYFYNIDKYRKTQYYHENFNIIDTINYLCKCDYMNVLNTINLYVLSEFIKDKNITIFSFEAHESGVLDNIDIHVNNNDINQFPFYGTTYNMNKDIITKKNIFIVDTYKHFIDNIDYYCNYFNLYYLKNEIIEEYKKYNYVENISFYKKSEKSIAIQWFGLSDKDIKIFLREYKWNDNLIDYYETNNLSHIKNEITINYDIIDNKLNITRTSIYGSI